MPLDPESGTFTRIWQFVDQFEAGDDVTREALDVALDDFVESINEALMVVATAAASAAAAAASAATASTAGAAAGEAAGAEAAEAAAAVHVAAMAAAVQVVEDLVEEVEGYVEQITPSNFLAFIADAYTASFDDIEDRGVYLVGSGTTGGPSGAAAGDRIIHLPADDDNAFQIVTSRGTGAPLSMRVKTSGSWGAWDYAVTTATAQTIAGAKTFSAAQTFTAQVTVAGAQSASVDDGTKSSGTYTPTPSGGNFRHITNGGAFTLAAPSASGHYTMVIEATNNASAGIVTTSGFLRVTGDALTTTNTHKFLLIITKTTAGSVLNVVALQ